VADSHACCVRDPRRHNLQGALGRDSDAQPREQLRGRRRWTNTQPGKRGAMPGYAQARQTDWLVVFVFDSDRFLPKARFSFVAGDYIPCGSQTRGGALGVVKRRTYLLFGLCCALVLVALPLAASAHPLAQGAPAWQAFGQTPDGPALNPYGQWLDARRTLLTDLDCLSNRGEVMTLKVGRSISVQPTVIGSDGRASTPLFLGFIGAYCYVPAELAQSMDRAAQQYVPAPALSTTPPADQGITLNMDAGGQQYLAEGTFVKIGDAPAIYRVDGGQLHAFSTWPEFIDAGGEPDLSNVTSFDNIHDGTGHLFGLPVEP
jgi:hypothetical protein